MTKILFFIEKISNSQNCPTLFIELIGYTQCDQPASWDAVSKNVNSERSKASKFQPKMLIFSHLIGGFQKHPKSINLFNQERRDVPKKKASQNFEKLVTPGGRTCSYFSQSCWWHVADVACSCTSPPAIPVGVVGLITGVDVDELSQARRPTLELPVRPPDAAAAAPTPPPPGTTEVAELDSLRLSESWSLSVLSPCSSSASRSSLRGLFSLSLGLASAGLFLLFRGSTLRSPSSAPGSFPSLSLNFPP